MRTKSSLCLLVSVVLASMACESNNNLVATESDAGGGSAWAPKATGGSYPTGGEANAGGGAEAGGSVGRGGAAAPGGSPSSGGMQTLGGSSSAGGSRLTGGTANTGGNAGGTANTGGMRITGGTASSGGTAGGTANTGGIRITGGTANAGGAQSAGGTQTSGGTSATGGAGTPSGGTGGTSGGSSGQVILTASYDGSVHGTWHNGLSETIYLYGCGTADLWQLESSGWANHGKGVACSWEGIAVQVAAGAELEVNPLEFGGLIRTTGTYRLSGPYALGCTAPDLGLSQANCRVQYTAVSNEFVVSELTGTGGTGSGGTSSTGGSGTGGAQTCAPGCSGVQQEWPVECPVDAQATWICQSGADPAPLVQGGCVLGILDGGTVGIYCCSSEFTAQCTG